MRLAIPALGMGKQEDPWGLLASQTGWLHASRFRDPVSKKEARSDWGSSWLQSLRSTLRHKNTCSLHFLSVAESPWCWTPLTYTNSTRLAHQGIKRLGEEETILKWEDSRSSAMTLESYSKNEKRSLRPGPLRLCRSRYFWFEIFLAKLNHFFRAVLKRGSLF